MVLTRGKRKVQWFLQKVNEDAMVSAEGKRKVESFL
jgi:hypothetical protein